MDSLRTMPEKTKSDDPSAILFLREHPRCHFLGLDRASFGSGWLEER
jgi:hypothetical protein